VELDAQGRPAAVRPRQNGRTAGTAAPHCVEAIGEIWRVDDEWWRQPISRRYFDVVLEGGGHVVLFEDLTTNQWWIQKP